MIIKIKNKKIGDNEPCFIIAEAGSNHNGSLEQAFKLVDVAVDSGADAVKFQTFLAKKMYSKKSKPVTYLKKLGVNKTIYKIIEEMEMPPDWLPKLSEYCKSKSIIFLTTPFDEDSADLIEPYVSAYKIASYELTHIPLLRHIAKKKKPMIVSTGAGTMEEIKEAVRVIKEAGNNNICLMQCTAKYPAPLNTINAMVIKTLNNIFKIPIGLSDHSRNPIFAPLAAMVAGASLIEKHFTLSNKLSGPDHLFALEPDELRHMVSFIRDVEVALGSSKKVLQKVEKELVNYRRVIFTIRNIKKGEKFTKNNIAVLRKSGELKEGIHSRQFNKILNKKANADVKKDVILLNQYIL